MFGQGVELLDNFRHGTSDHITQLRNLAAGTVLECLCKSLRTKLCRDSPRRAVRHGDAEGFLSTAWRLACPTQGELGSLSILLTLILCTPVLCDQLS